MAPARKRFGATFRTLNDMTNNSPEVDENGAGTQTSNITVQHIPSLPDHTDAAEILRRIHAEFHVIIERRGWTVTSITEMCCCGDGIDCLKKRKTKVMPNNVLGYNRTSSSRRGKVHDIHLRLRHPRTHVLLDYESIAGTMCHELAHCVRGPHDAKFYKAMEEIEEQYAVYLAKGVVLDKQGFPLGSSESRVLGRSGGGTSNGKRKIVSADRRKALQAAEARRKKGGLTQGYTLGGKSALSTPPDPRHAGRMAAERRLFDAQYCLPCNEVIEILGDDSSDEESDDEVEVIETDAGAAKREAQSDKEGRAQKESTTSDGVVDLTMLDDSFTMSPVPLRPTAKAEGKHNQKQRAPPGRGPSNWTCPRCTLSNPEDILVCDACHSKRPCHKTVLEQAREFKAKDDIALVKEREVELSKETFGGFNIYGEKKQSSVTMKHLT